MPFNLEKYIYWNKNSKNFQLQQFEVFELFLDFRPNVQRNPDTTTSSANDGFNFVQKKRSETERESSITLLTSKVFPI